MLILSIQVISIMDIVARDEKKVKRVQGARLPGV